MEMKSPCSDTFAVLRDDGRIEVAGSVPTTKRWPANVDRWRSIIEEASARRGVPPAIIAAFMAVESGGQPGVVSYAGAMGLMQLMPETYNMLAGLPRGTPVDREAATEPFTNTDLGAKLIASNLKRYQGNLVSAAAAYNAGSPRCGVYCRKTGEGTVCCPEDEWGLKTDCGYVQKILAAYNAAVDRKYDWQKSAVIVPALLRGWETGRLSLASGMWASAVAVTIAGAAVAGGALIVVAKPALLGGK